MEIIGNVDISNYGIFTEDYMPSWVDGQPLGKEISDAIQDSISGDCTSIDVDQDHIDVRLGFLCIDDVLAPLTIRWANEDFVRDNCFSSKSRDDFVEILGALITIAKSLEYDKRNELIWPVGKDETPEEET